jgi:hypothetical protein
MRIHINEPGNSFSALFFSESESDERFEADYRCIILVAPATAVMPARQSHSQFKGMLEVW